MPAVRFLLWDRYRRLIQCATLLTAVTLIEANPVEGLTANLVFAEQTAAAQEASDQVEVKVDNGTHRITERQKKAYIGLAAIAGIIIAGLGIVALTMVWAGRLRRQLRQTPPECEIPKRDFWFLQPPKTVVTKSSLPEVNIPPQASPPEPEDGK